MTTQTFSASATTRVTLADCEGDLVIEAWGEPGIAVEAEEGASAPAQEGEALAIRGARGPLRLRVPGQIAVTVEGQRGAVTLRNLYGPALVDGAASFRIEGDGDWRRWLSRRPWQEHNVEVRNVGAVDIDYVIGSLRLSDIQSADARAIGGNLTVRAAKGDVRIKNVGGGSSIAEIGGDLEVGNVGGNCEIRGVEGNLQIANVGGNADVHSVGAVLKLGNIGGNLTLSEAPLSSAFAAEQPARIAVGGNLRIELPDQPDLTIRAVVGGRVRGEGIASHIGGMVTLVYGPGTGQLSLLAGGNLDLYGGGAPQVTSASWQNWGEFGREISRQGRELGRIGRDLGREFGGLGRDLGREFADIGREIGRAMAEAFDARRERADPPRQASEERAAAIREQRAAVVRMVAEKRITAEEGAALLRALGE